MTMYSKEIGRTGITIDVRGNLLKDGRRRIEPAICPDTGYPSFQVPDPETPSRLRKEYVHVQVFRVHSGVPIRRRLASGDVEPINGNRLRTDLTNLRLTKSGMEKVYGDSANKSAVELNPDGDTAAGVGESEVSAGESEGGEPVDTSPAVGPDKPVKADGGTGEDAAVTEEPAAEKEKSGESEASEDKEAVQEATQEATQTAAQEDAQKTTQDAPKKTAKKTSQDVAQPVVTARRTKPNSKYYDVFDADGNSVLGQWNNGKKINGDANVQKVAEKNGCKLVFGDPLA